MREPRHRGWCCGDPNCRVSGCDGCNCAAAQRALADERAQRRDSQLVAMFVIVGIIAWAATLATSGFVSNASFLVQVACALGLVVLLLRARRRNRR